MTYPCAKTAVVTKGNCLFMIGGNINVEFSSKTIVNYVHCYDSVSDIWTVLSPMLTTRERHVAVLCGNFILAVGGHSHNSNTPLSSVERYDIANDTWSYVKSYNLPVSSAAAFTFKGQVYVSGGYTGPVDVVTKQIMAYEEDGNVWLNKGQLSAPRQCHGMCEDGTNLYVIGGFKSNIVSSDVEIFDMKDHVLSASARTW